ncbi:hypothetical protein [Okeania sp. SIO2C9]|nr:hypothetical protein [Okeania sp. SIO2C9]
MGRWGMGRLGDWEIGRLGDGTFFYTELNGFDIKSSALTQRLYI